MTQNSKNSLLRLNKALSLAGVCSRRKAEEWIKKGWIKVNQQTVQELGCKINPARDRIQVQDKALPLISDQVQEHIHLVLHKPAQVVCTLHDPQNRACIPDLLPEEMRAYRLLPAGRLDYMSEGLLLLSTDGELIQNASHPSRKKTKTYQVLIREKVNSRKLEAMTQGMQLQEGEQLAPVQARVLGRRQKQGTWLELVLQQGINRQIRRMCRDLELTILQLIRTRQGPVHLGDLPPGQYRFLTAREIKALQTISKTSNNK